MRGNSMDNKLSTLLLVNHVNPDSCLKLLYKTLQTQCFVEICDILIADSCANINARTLFRSFPPDFASKRLVEKYCSYCLDQDSYSALGVLFEAFFRKNNTRCTYSTEYKKIILQKQHFRCAICKKPVSEASHLDHIIPWKYVGDELEDNLQMLCASCNHKKQASISYPLLHILANTKKNNL